MRIKCPICQNTTAITLIWEDTESYSTTHIREYKCKCGCVFEVKFTAENPKILQFPIDYFPKMWYNKNRD